MEQYVKYLRKSRFDRDYADLSIEETLKRHEAILDKLANDRGYYIAKTYYEVVSGESIAARPEIQKMLEEVSAGLYAGVLVVDVERLARGNGADQAYISQVFQFSGTKIITPTKMYDPSNEFDEEYFEFGVNYFRAFLFFTWLNFLQPISSMFFSSIGKAYKGTFLSHILIHVQRMM